jgi:hypothetical protein
MVESSYIELDDLFIGGSRTPDSDELFYKTALHITPVENGNLKIGERVSFNPVTNEDVGVDASVNAMTTHVQDGDTDPVFALALQDGVIHADVPMDDYKSMLRKSQTFGMKEAIEASKDLPGLVVYSLTDNCEGRYLAKVFDDGELVTIFDSSDEEAMTAPKHDVEVCDVEDMGDKTIDDFLASDEIVKIGVTPK